MAENLLQVDEEKCIGCRACSRASQGDIRIEEDGAKRVITFPLVSGDCAVELCPAGALSLVEAEAKAKDQAEPCFKDAAVGEQAPTEPDEALPTGRHEVR